MSNKRKLMIGFCVSFGLLLEAEEAEKIERKRKRIRNVWSKEIWLSRDRENVFESLMDRLKYEGEEFYKKFVRLSYDEFDFIHARIEKKIKKQDTVMRKAIGSRERLAVTLWYLASGDSYNTLSAVFHIPPCTIAGIVDEICKAIFGESKEDYLKTPSTPAEWKKIADEFWSQWNFPNCIGSLDGKHIAIKKPPKSASEYYNYKHFCSTVLMALSDANYCFTYVNIGAKGSASDGGVFSLCKFAEKLANEELNLPPNCSLPERDMSVPFVIVADDAFALQQHIIKPYSKRALSLPQRVFNYRLSRAKRTIENAFGIASARFRCLRRTFEMGPEKVKTIVSAVCVLHNICMQRCKNLYAPNSYIDSESESGVQVPGAWRMDSPQGFTDLNHLATQNISKEPKENMKEFADFFLTEAGEVKWQYKSCGIGN